MKKCFLPLLLALLMIFVLPVQASSAFGSATDALCTIYLRRDAGDTLLGTGVAFIRNDTILTVEGCIREGELVVLSSGGEHRVTSVRAEESGAALLTIDPPVDAAPVSLADYSMQAVPYVLSASADGQRAAEPLYQVLMTRYRGTDALLLSSEDGLLPGAIVLDEAGALVCITAARNGEGVGMYTALDISSLYGLSIELDDISDTEAAYVKASISWQDGVLDISWPDANHTEGVYFITVGGRENRYYSSYTAGAIRTGISILLPLGHSYDVQVQWTPDKTQPLPINWYIMQEISLPEDAYTDHGFTCRSYVSALPAGSAIPDGLFPETEFLSVDMVTGGAYDLYFQSIAEYQVDEQIPLPMTAELIAPDGQFYYLDLEFVFDPALQGADVFYLPLGDLFAECLQFTEGNALAPGEYRLRYAIAGKTADEYVFTLAPEGTAAPEETNSSRSAGFLTGYTVACEGGYVTLDWSNLTALPTGEDLTYVAFIQYGENAYYTYYEMAAEARQAEFHAIPGVDCVVWLAYTHGDSIAELHPQSPDECTFVPAAQKQPFTLNGFTHVRAGLAASDAESPEDDGVYLPEAPITRQMLTDRAVPVYFQTEDTYSVTEISSDYPMAIVLFTPDGLVFAERSGYVFMPEICDGDIWARNLEALLSSYESLTGDAAWPAGEYTIGYYIGGFVADEFTFTLE